MLSLEPESSLERVSMQALPAQASACLLVEIDNQLCLHVGLESGVLQRSVVDNITGGISDSRSKSLG